MQPAHNPFRPWTRHLKVLSTLLALAPALAQGAENLSLERVKLLDHVVDVFAGTRVNAAPQANYSDWP